MSENLKAYLNEISQVRPSRRQLAWFEMGAYAFIHFGVNTFTNKEWGDGTEAEELFFPEKLDCDQWARVIRGAGLKGMILTAKHHDGFCLWPSAYTEHSVKNSPLGRDVVKEAAEACRKEGLRFGFYLSPWDRNSKLYGTEAYNDYFCNQLTELLTGYGPIFCVWFDGACGEGPNGKKQIYDFKRYEELVRTYQPDAVIFHDEGPDVRWCGNEAGASRHAEWAVVPSELCKRSEVQTGPGPLAGEGDLGYLYNTDQQVGSLSSAFFSRGLTFTPSEIDMSMRPGWFYHPEEKPHSLERLFKTYLQSWGGNACLNLNIPPTKEGLISKEDAARLAELGELIRKSFGAPLQTEDLQEEKDGPYQARFTLNLKEPTDKIRFVVLREKIEEGQRIESFRILGRFAGGSEVVLYEGTTVGNRRVCYWKDPFDSQNPLTDMRKSKIIESLTLHVTSSRGKVRLREMKVY